MKRDVVRFPVAGIAFAIVLASARLPLPAVAATQAGAPASGTPPPQQAMETPQVVESSRTLGPPQALEPPQTVDTSQALELTLLEAIEMALEQNLQLQISRVGTEVSREGINRARGFLDPTVTLDIPGNLSGNISPQASQIDGAVVGISNDFRGGFSWNERLIWGTQYSVGWTGSRSSTNSSFSTVNPRYQSGLNFSVTQPLLRGFGREVTTAPILVADYGYSRNQEQLRLDTQQVALDTYGAYWDLVFRYQELDVRRDSLQLAQRQAQRSERQRELGTAELLDVVQGEVRVSDEEVRLLQAELALQDAQEQLKRLLNIDALGADYWDVDIRPTDTPEYVLRPLDLDEAIATAMQRDPLIAQLRIDAASQGVDLNTARNNLLPELDVTASLGLSGQGGDRIIRGGDLGGTGTEIVEGGLTESLSNMFSGDFRNWSIQAMLSMPIRNTEARAAHAQAELQQRQNDLRIRDREQLLRVNLRAAIRRLQSLREQVAGAVTAREAAERQLRVAELQADLAAGDVFQLLTFQVELANARSRELQLIIDFNNAYADFEATKGTLLQSLGIAFRE